MANFWDLPRPVRDKIYRLHLVHDKPLDPRTHQRFCSPYMQKGMPNLLRVSDRCDREAAPIYYGENHFILNSLDPEILTYCTMPRHIRQVQKLTCDWNPDGSSAASGLKTVARFTGLKELNLRVDEREMVRKCMRSRGTRQYWSDDRDPTAQEQLTIFQFPGMDALLALTGIPIVNFLKRLDQEKKEFGGPLIGGVLLTHVLPKITARTNVKKRKAKKVSAGTSKPIKAKKGKLGQFDFLGLPAELRNRVYELLLDIEGPIHPSKALPSSVPKRNKHDQVVPGSALSLLGANKQIYNEAAGIFYAVPLMFYFPTQLAAFLVDLSSFRLSLIRDVTVLYDNARRGGIEVVDVCFSLLRNLIGLRKLRITMHADLFNKIQPRRYQGGWHMDHANPALLPGMKVLFSLRGIADVEVSDNELKNQFERAKKEKEYPDFETQSRSYHVLKLTQALEHFNGALQEAQSGIINAELLENKKWHTWDEFPEMPEEDDSDDEGEESSAREEEGRQESGTGKFDQGDVGDSDQSTIAAGPVLPFVPRRSARLSTKADQAQSEEQRVAEENAEGGEQSRDDAEDVGEEISVYRRGRAASPEL